MREEPHHLFSCKGGQGLPPRRACVNTLRVRVDSPIPQLFEQDDHELHSLTMQCRGPPLTRHQQFLLDVLCVFDDV